MPILSQVLGRIRQAMRGLHRSPGYSAPIIVSLALGIGLNTTIFAVIDGVLRRPLPYADEERLVAIGRELSRADQPPRTDWDRASADFEVWEKGLQTIESFALFSENEETALVRDISYTVRVGAASHNFLEVLGTRPALGRWFQLDENYASAVVVLSHDFWRRAFGGDSGVVGQSMMMHGQPATVVGVLFPRGELPAGAAYWRPFNLGAQSAVGLRGPQFYTAQAVARIREGASLTEVQTELHTASPTVATLRSRGYRFETIVMPLRERLYGSARLPLQLTFGAALLLLAIACANVASLLLARTLQRGREMGIRLTLGAGRGSLAVLLLTENLLLAIVGSAAGAVLALWGTKLVLAMAPEDITRVSEIGVRTPSLLFAGGIAIVAAIVVSIAPLLAVTDHKMGLMLNQSGTRTGHGRTPQRLRRLLIAVQFAVALVLATGGGLLIRSVARLSAPDHLGFSPEGVLVVSLDARGPRYREPGARNSLVQEVSARIRALPGVEKVAVGPAPVVGGRGEVFREGFSVIGNFRNPDNPDLPPVSYWLKVVDPDYLGILKIRMRDGRPLLDTDGPDAPSVAVINSSAATGFFGDQSPLGKPLPPGIFREFAQPVTVVGVVEDFLQRAVELDAAAEILIPAAQGTARALPGFVIRTSGSPEALVPGVRSVLKSIDPQLATSRLEPMERIVTASLRPFSFMLFLLRAFAILGLILAAVGLYATMSYVVTRRHHEIGVRLALGAQRRSILGLMVSEGAWLAAGGVAVGVPAALVLTRFLTNYLYGVKPHDLATFAVSPVVLTAVALLAAYIPARKAARIDPVVTLRAD